MDGIEMTNKLFQAIEGKDKKTAATYLTDHFTFSGPVPQPISGTEWLNMQQALSRAFPDWKFNATDLREEGGKVQANVQITGTHTGELDLSSLGLPNVPATGKKIKLPREAITLSMSDGRFSSLVNTPTPGGGVMGILSQLGVKVPVAH
jgi:predicted ester cyclase